MSALNKSLAAVRTRVKHGENLGLVGPDEDREAWLRRTQAALVDLSNATTPAEAHDAFTRMTASAWASVVTVPAEL